MITASNILDEIIDCKRQTLVRAKTEVSAQELVARAQQVREAATPFGLRAAISNSKERFAIIAEFKRASPSRGNFALHTDAAAVTSIFAQHGACAVSVVTEEKYFRGSLEDLRSAKRAVSIPLLRKDFILDEYQVYESAAAGADALLLIAAALNDSQLATLRRLTEEELEMDALVEAQDLAEVFRAVNCGARLIGINNRNLRDFSVSLATSYECAAIVPDGTILISESGLSKQSDLEKLKARGFSGFLIGEALMADPDPGPVLAELLSPRRQTECK